MKRKEGKCGAKGREERFEMQRQNTPHRYGKQLGIGRGKESEVEVEQKGRRDGAEGRKKRKRGRA